VTKKWLNLKNSNNNSDGDYLDSLYDLDTLKRNLTSRLDPLFKI
jgi:hypothetical protein